MKFSVVTIIISLIIVAIALTQLDIVKLVNAIFLIDPMFLAMALGAWIILLFLKVWKWSLVVQALGGKISLKESFIALMIGLFIGVITPGRVGDFVRAAYVKHTLPWGKGLMGVVIDRALDILTLLVFALLGVFWLSISTGFTLIRIEIVMALTLLAVIATILVLNKWFMKTFLLPLAKRFLSSSMMEMLQRLGKEFYSSIPILKKNSGTIFAVILLSVLSWIGAVTFGYFLMLGAGIRVDWSVALLTIPVISLIEILPISVIGVGARELSAILVLKVFGVLPEAAVLFSLLYFVFGYIPSMLIGMILFNSHPIPMNEELQKLFGKYLKQKK